MATTKTNRQAIEKKQKNAFRCQIKKYQEANELLDELSRMIREQKRMNLEAIQQLKVQMRKQKDKNKDVNGNGLSWNDDTPLVELVYSWKMAAFNKMIHSWKKHSRVEINPQETSHFDFDLVFKKNIISDLKLAMKQENVFRVSDAQVITYMSRHSNLGSFDAIKKAIQRLEDVKK